MLLFLFGGTPYCARSIAFSISSAKTLITGGINIIHRRSQYGLCGGMFGSKFERKRQYGYRRQIAFITQCSERLPGPALS